MADRDPIVADALAFQKLSAEAFGGQRRRENDALKFLMDPWLADVKQQRSGQSVNGVPIPARPMLSIPTLSQPIQSIYNQWSRAHYGVLIHPQSPEADDETAEIFQDLYRQMEVDSRAYIGRGWGFDRALKAGMGGYRMRAVYDESTDDPDDQKLVIERIFRQASIYWDPFSVEPDFSDQRRNLIVSFLSRADFKRQYPTASLNDLTSEELLEMQAQIPNWARLNSSGERETMQEKWYDAANDTVCVAEFCKTEYVDVPRPPGTLRTTHQKPVIQWYKIDAMQVLESTTLDCAYIPVIPTIGNEQQPFDSERYWQGIVEPNADSARLLNYEVSNAVETDALRPKAPFIGYVGQFKTNQAQWQLANVRNLPYLEADPIMVGGHLAGLPERNLTSVDLSSSIALIQLAKESLQTGTAQIDPAALENLAKRKVAHQTLGAMADSNQTSQSQFIQNMADLSMSYEAKIFLSWAPSIYDREGRAVTVRNEKGEVRSVLMNQPYVLDKRKRPVPVPAGANAMPPGQSSPKPKFHNLKKGVYGLVASVGRSYINRQQQGSDAIGELMKAIPELSPALAPIWARFQDFPGHDEVESVLKKMQPPQLQTAEEGEPEDAETLKNQRDQAMQIADQLKQQLAEASKIIETKQVESQGKLQQAELDGKVTLQKAQMDAQIKIEVARMQIAADVEIAAMKAENDHALEAAKLAHADLDREDTQRFEHAEEAVNRAHELEIERQKAEEAEKARQHAAEIGEQGHQHTLAEGEQAHVQGLESQSQAESAAERQAKLKPKAGE